MRPDPVSVRRPRFRSEAIISVGPDMGEAARAVRQGFGSKWIAYASGAQTLHVKGIPTAGMVPSERATLKQLFIVTGKYDPHDGESANPFGETVFILEPLTAQEEKQYLEACQAKPAARAKAR